jgi:hypothetical protein
VIIGGPPWPSATPAPSKQIAAAQKAALFNWSVVTCSPKDESAVADH